MTVQARPDYRIRATLPAPAGYPSAAAPDSFAEQPFHPEYAARRQAFFAHVLRNPAPQNTKAAWHELARLAAGGRPHEGFFQASLDYIEARKDCADFVLHACLRLLYQFPASPGLDAPVYTRARSAALNFKYFPDEPGVDSLCTWTENHYILYTSAAYLAGQLFPSEIFTNSGETGQQKMALNRPRILHWLALRFRTGFSEWLSNVYYDEHLTALLSLYDFAADDEIRRKAEVVLDLLLLDMALNSFRGVFGASHGRSYEESKQWASQEGTTDAFKLLFGVGIFSGYDNMSAAALALSGYRPPQAIAAIAHDPKPVENRQRMGIKLAEMEKWGLRPDNFEDGMHLLTLEAYAHPRTFANTLRMADRCNWWENAFLSGFKPYRRVLKAAQALGLLPGLARFLGRDLCRNTREEVNLYTYKTPDYMLSTAQDYRKGYGGDQQHIWQATLGLDAVCFTTHPARLSSGPPTPSYWTGSGLLPRAAQYKNVVVVIYRLTAIPALYVPIRLAFTHAWLPRDRFDQVLERSGWIFARKGHGYLALRSQQAYFWHTAAGQPKQEEKGSRNPAPPVTLRNHPEDLGREIVAPGKQNIWICQLGRQAEDGDFTAFVNRIAAAQVAYNGLNVAYQSPGNGLIRFGWEGAFSLDGVAIALDSYPRYANPYVRADFDPDEITLASGGYTLTLDWQTALSTGEREPG